MSPEIFVGMKLQAFQGHGHPKLKKCIFEIVLINRKRCRTACASREKPESSKKKNRNPSNIDRDMAKNAKTGSSHTTDVILRRFPPNVFLKYT